MVSIEIPDTFTPGWGGRLTLARKSLKRTQADIGSILGVRNTAVSKWEQEGTDKIDDRSLRALHAALGINPRFLACGEEPMLFQTWNRDVMRQAYETAAGCAIDGIWCVPQAHGMAPILRDGDVVSFASEPIRDGALVLVCPQKQEAVSDGIASTKCLVGRAVATGNSWLLYREEDRVNPGSFPAVELSSYQYVGRVVSITRPVPADPVGWATMFAVN